MTWKIARLAKDLTEWAQASIIANAEALFLALMVHSTLSLEPVKRVDWAVNFPDHACMLALLPLSLAILPPRFNQTLQSASA